MALHWNLDELGYKFCTPHPTLFLFGSCFELFLHISHLCCHWPSFSYKNVWNNLSGDIRKQLVWRANTYVCSAHALIIRRSIETSVQHKFTKYMTEGPYTLCKLGCLGLCLTILWAKRGQIFVCQSTTVVLDRPRETHSPTANLELWWPKTQNKMRDVQ